MRKGGARGIVRRSIQRRHAFQEAWFCVCVCVWRGARHKTQGTRQDGRALALRPPHLLRVKPQLCSLSLIVVSSAVNPRRFHMETVVGSLVLHR